MRRKKSTPVKTTGNVLEVYQSVAELSAMLNNSRPHDDWTNPMAERIESYQKNWCGETFADATRKLSTGDEELAAKIKAQGEILNEAHGGAMPRIEVGVYGCIPSVPNYLRGVPANMMRVVREPRRNPVIDIYVESSIYDGINTDKVAEKAAIIANVITATEIAGVRVNLYSVNATYDKLGDGTVYACITKIKDAQSPLNLLNIAFPICNRAMSRMCFLSWVERISVRHLQNYGSPMSGENVKSVYNLDGVVLSIRDMVDCNLGLYSVTHEINKYLKSK